MCSDPQRPRRLFGLIGYPLGHSFSQEWFARMFARKCISDAEYRNFPLESIDGLAALRAEYPGLRGHNVTAPYKVEVMRFLDRTDPTAAEIGAVNCVVRQGGLWTGYNVDWIGFARSLTEFAGTDLPPALVLGSGGASRAASYALRRLGCDYAVVSRSGAEGTIGYDDLTPRVMACRKLIISATPLGTWPHTESAAPIPYELLGPSHLLYDMVYNPSVTAFMRQGLEAGAHATNGLRMLELQAEASWELFRTAD